MTEGSVTQIDQRRTEQPLRTPYNGEAEASVLGSCITSPPFLKRVLSILVPEDFFDLEHRAAFSAICKLVAEAKDVDPVTVTEELRRSRAVERPHLLVNELEHLAGTDSSALGHARIVFDKSRARRAISAASEVARLLQQERTVDDLRTQFEKLEQVFRTATRDASESVRAVPGGSFILDAPADVDAVWGEGPQVLWARGESLIISGPTGVGKTTLAQQLVLQMLGIGDGRLLGLPVTAADRRILYIAADRPSQVQRSFARMGLSESDRALLDSRLTVWMGPPPELLTTHPKALLDLAKDHQAGLVVLDSLKDVAVDLVKDEVGSRLNQCFQEALAEGVDVLALHHQRKGQSGGTRPNKLEDIYGSTWITAGAGSVVLLWGEPGDPVVTLDHLKQPAEPIGPLRLLHDQHAGVTTIMDSVDVFELVRTSTNGVTAQEVARQLFDSDTPNDVNKARRRLQSLVNRKPPLAHHVPGSRGGAKGARNHDRWYPISLLEDPS